jgi:hypothetical protein
MIETRNWNRIQKKKKNTNQAFKYGFHNSLALALFWITSARPLTLTYDWWDGSLNDTFTCEWFLISGTFDESVRVKNLKINIYTEVFIRNKHFTNQSSVFESLSPCWYAMGRERRLPSWSVVVNIANWMFLINLKTCS